MKIPHIFILVGYDLSIFEWQLRINLPYKGRLQKTRWKFKIIFSIKRRIPRPNGYNFHPFFTPLFFLFQLNLTYWSVCAGREFLWSDILLCFLGWSSFPIIGDDSSRVASRSVRVALRCHVRVATRSQGIEYLIEHSETASAADQPLRVTSLVLNILQIWITIFLRATEATKEIFE